MRFYAKHKMTIPPSKLIVRKSLTVLLIIVVAASVVTIGSVAQTDSENTMPNDAEESDDWMSNATYIQYGDEVSGTLSSPTDVDYYAVNASAGDGVITQLRLKNIFEGSAIRVDIIDPNGSVSTEISADLIDGPDNIAGERRPTGPVDEAKAGDVMETNGTYYIRVQEADEISGDPDKGAQTNESDEYQYSLTASKQDLDEYDPNEDSTTATTINLNQTRSALLTGYDTDTYALNVTADEEYTIETSTINNPEVQKQVTVFENASLATDDPDAWMQKNSVASVEITSSGKVVTFTAETNGTYYVQVTESEQNTALAARENYSLQIEQTRSSEFTDSDGDGLFDREEEQTSTNPNSADSDDDGLTDSREIDLETDPTDADTDNDGLSDGREVDELGTDPNDSNTDDDGFTDGCELSNNTDPVNSDTDDDGVLDGEEV